MKHKSLAVFALIAFITSAGWATTQTVLWNFNGVNGDGSSPWSNFLISDSKGNLYGVTASGGTNSTGMAFELSPDGSGGYNETILYDFQAPGSGDGSTPYGSLVFDKDGDLYGTTQSGGVNGTGTIYRLAHKSGGKWVEKVLYSFSASGVDGAGPAAGLTMDAKGALYGTTSGGGANGVGAVFKLAKSKTGWVEKVLHSFVFSNSDGAFPYDGLMLDASGNLYGTAPSGGAAGYGVVYRLKPGKKGYTETLLHSFTDNGTDGSGMYYVNLTSDKAGNIYGATGFGGTNNNGTVWELVYSKAKNKYTEKVLYSFGASGGGDGNYPYGGVILGKSGHLYGTTESGGSGGGGTVYELTKSGKTWSETILYNFTGGSDGQYPSANLLRDASGNLYGMAQFGGANNLGVVYQVKP